MKLFHLSDLHIGKRVNEFSMIEDQKYILSQILHAAKIKKPDGILLSGDIYDSTIPSAEAVQVFDAFLTELSAEQIPAFIISGNHDSAERLAFGSSLMEKSGIYFSRVYDGTIEKIPLQDAYGTVWIHLLPFLRPAVVRHALPEPAPLVSIVIPTKDHIETLDACVMSIAQKATYTNYEIVLVENNSEAPETFAYYETLPERVAAASEGKGIARVVYWPGEFNYSQIINFGVKHAKGDYLSLIHI